MHYTMYHVQCHGSQTTVRRYLGLDNPASQDVTTGQHGGTAHRGLPGGLCYRTQLSVTVETHSEDVRELTHCHRYTRTAQL
jgi:hypothetical protein